MAPRAPTADCFRPGGPWRALAAGLAVALGALLMGGCSRGQSSATIAADQKFIAEVHQSVPNINAYRSDAQILRLGLAACDGFRAGASTVEVADRLEIAETSIMPAQDLGAIIAGAANYLCFQYHTRLSPLSGS